MWPERSNLDRCMVRISHFATPLASGSDDWREVAVIKHSCGPSEQCSNSHMAGRDAKAKEMVVLFEQRAVSDGSEMHVFWKLKCLLILLVAPTLSLGEVVDLSEVVHGEGLCSPSFVFFFFPGSLRDIW